MEIKSLQNEKIKLLKKAFDKKRTAKELNIFFIEGLKLFKDFFTSGNEYKYILYSPSVLFSKDEIETIDMLENLEEDDNESVFRVPKSILNKFSTISGDQGVLVIAERFYLSLSDVITDKKDVIALAGIQDPGNFGTILRLAEGLGIGGIIVSSDTVSEFNEKTVRASMGSILNVPVYRSENLVTTLTDLKKQGYIIAGTVLNDGENITEFTTDKPTVYIFGNEGSGIPDKIIDIVDKKLTIPLKGSVESFNVAISAALTLCQNNLKRG